MPEKRVRFANTVGRPLTSVRKINAVGAGARVLPSKRTFIPADLKLMKTRHENAMKRAMEKVSDAKRKFQRAKELGIKLRNTQQHVQKMLAKEKNPLNVRRIRAYANKLISAKNDIVRDLNSRKINLNLEQGKLEAQKNLGMKKRRFRLM